MRPILLAAAFILAALCAAPAFARPRSCASCSSCPDGTCNLPQRSAPVARQSKPKTCPETCYGPNGCSCVDNGGTCNCHELKARKSSLRRVLDMHGCAADTFFAAGCVKVNGRSVCEDFTLAAGDVVVVSTANGPRTLLSR